MTIVLDTNVIYSKNNFLIDKVKLSSLNKETLFRKTFFDLIEWSSNTTNISIKVTKTVMQEVTSQLNDLKGNVISNVLMDSDIKGIFLKKIENSLSEIKDLSQKGDFILPVSSDIEAENNKLKECVINNKLNDFIINREINDFAEQNKVKKEDIIFLSSNLSDFKDFNKKYFFNSFSETSFLNIKVWNDFNKSDALWTSIINHIQNYWGLSSVEEICTPHSNNWYHLQQLKLSCLKIKDDKNREKSIYFASDIKINYDVKKPNDDLVWRYAFFDAIFFNEEWRIIDSRGHLERFRMY